MTHQPTRLLLSVLIAALLAGILFPAAALAAPADTTTCAAIYIVQRGDTLLQIARSHGTTVAALKQLNNLANVNRINAGQRLCLAHSLPPAATGRVVRRQAGGYPLSPGADVWRHDNSHCQRQSTGQPQPDHHRPAAVDPHGRHIGPLVHSQTGRHRGGVGPGLPQQR